MNTAKIEELKRALDIATLNYEAKKEELTLAGIKSKDRYEALKSLKAEQDAANSAYVKYAHGQIKRDLHIICAGISTEKKAEKAAKRAARFA